MSGVVKIELLSDKNLSIGDRLWGHLIEDVMYDNSMPIRNKYLLRLFDKNNISCGFGVNDSLFSKHNVGDIVQSICDLKLDVGKEIEFEIVESKDIAKNNKNMFILKLLDNKISMNILGVVEEEVKQLMISEYLTDDIKNKFNDNLQHFTSKEMILDVKGDAKLNPKKTTVSRLLKNYENPTIHISLDKDGKWRVIYENEYAGEVLDVPQNIDISDIIGVKCQSSISLGYSIKVEYRKQNEDTDTQVNTKKSVLDEAIEESIDSIEGEKGLKVDEEEFVKIVNYLNECKIPSEYIKKITSSYIEYDKKYFDRIPSSYSKDFKTWKMPKDGNNLLLKAIVFIEEGINARFVGGKGAGKDTLLSTLGWIYQRPVFTQSANRDTDITHLFGDKSLNPKNIDGNIMQTIGFKRGLLIEAMEVGGIYEFGEGNTCRPELTMALHSILDHRRSVEVEGYKLVKAHPNFSFVLTMNVDYDGCNELNQAFQDRFATIKFPPPKDIEFILKDSCPYAKKEDIKICNKIYKSILELSSEFQTDTMVTIRGYINALRLSKHLPIADALECSIIDNLSDDMLISNKIRHIVENIIG